MHKNMEIKMAKKRRFGDRIICPSCGLDTVCDLSESDCSGCEHEVHAIVERPAARYIALDPCQKKEAEMRAIVEFITGGYVGVFSMKDHE